MNTKEILKLPMDKNDSGETTIGDYLKALLLGVWEKGEKFNGKRPFGNSGWEYDIYRPLIQAGLVKGFFDEHGYIEEFSEVEEKKAKDIIIRVIEDIFTI